MKKSVCIVGGGISGLTAAYRLQKEGIPVAVFEAGNEPGGAIHTHKHNGWLVEAGPNTVRYNSLLVESLIKELGIENDLIFAGPQAKNRYIVKQGAPQALPSSLTGFLKTPLFGKRAKWGLLAEPFAAKYRYHEDESIADFVTRRLGRDFLDYAVDPFVSGIYAGDPNQLSVEHTFGPLYEFDRKYGSIFLGALRSAIGGKNTGRPKKRGIFSFSQGMNTLPYALAKTLGSSFRPNTRVKSIAKLRDRWYITTESGDEHECGVVIYSAPLHQLSSIDIKTDVRWPLAELTSMEYAPIAMLSLGFNRAHVKHPLDGFGMLVPGVENSPLLGVLFPSSIFENRAPDGHVLMSCFIGGAKRPELLDLDQNEIQKLVMAELYKYLGVNGEPAFVHFRSWKRGIPQYNKGFGAFLIDLKFVEDNNPGFLFASNFRGGVAVPNCLENAWEAAGKTLEFLNG